MEPDSMGRYNLKHHEESFQGSSASVIPLEDARVLKHCSEHPTDLVSGKTPGIKLNF